MNRLCIFLIVLFSSPAIGLAQQERDGNDSLRLEKPEAQVLVGPVRSKRQLQRPGERMFDTSPMPNVYQGDYAIAMPNAYQGDNCVPMPNVYQGKPAERIINVRPDSAGNIKPDSLLRERYKPRDTLENRKPKE
ncbi:hypothetical protein [Parapedobacter sp.]